MRRAPALTSACLLAGLAALLGGCGNTLQTYPIPHNLLENLLVAPQPVYWLGGKFHGLEVTEASRDVSGAYEVQYGNCLSGGEGSCIPPLRVITSPDNSFLPGGQALSGTASVRGQTARLTDAGRSLSLATGEVVVDIDADNAALAIAAARQMAPINRPEAPGQTLPPRLPYTGFASKPLPVQEPALVRPLGFTAPNP